MNLRFGSLLSFWWLIAIPLIILFLLWAYRVRRSAMNQFASEPLAEHLTRSINLSTRRWKSAMLAVIIMLAAFALTRPQWGFEWREVTSRGVDVFVLLDVSKSMLAEDVRPNRLTQAKFAVEDLLTNLAGDRVGLIAFAGTAFVQCPLTVDYEAFRLTLKDVDPNVIPRGGSSIGLAIQTAIKAFEAGEGRDRAIVLITDGEDTTSDPVVAAKLAADAGIRIFAIGVGTTDGELIPIRQKDKSFEFLKDREGIVVKSRLAEQPLKEMALNTQGIYVRTVPGNFGMDTIYNQGIKQMRPKDYEARLQKRYLERFQWPLGIAVVLFLVQSFMSERRKR